MDYPVNSVCVIVNTNDKFMHFLGRECTIAEPRKLRSNGKYEYLIHVQGEKGNYSILHEDLRIKKLPPDEAFDKFLNKLTKPVQSTKPVEEAA